MSLLKNIVRSSDRGLFTSSISSTTIRSKFHSPKTFNRVPLLPHEFYATTRRFNYDPKFKAFKDRQAKMQCDDGYPVHLKGGIIDKILYHVTVGGCMIGLAQSFSFLYNLATTT